jgi:hypothetical protein
MPVRPLASSAALLLVACSVSVDPVAPAGERMERDWLDRWEVPALACPRGVASKSVDDAGVVTQACMSGAVVDGPYVQWHPHGQKAAEGLVQGGRLEGAWVWWHANGRIATRGRYRDDAEEGEWTWWHDNGKTEQRGAFMSGARTGEWAIWYPDGGRRSLGRYDLGHKDGRWRYWSPDGTPEREEQWSLRRLVQETELEGGRRLRLEAEAAERSGRAGRAGAR